MVERDRVAYAALAENSKSLSAGDIELRFEDAFSFLAADRRLFDDILSTLPRDSN